jgi:site-specific DNA-methyltransferase (adenine-specific)
MDLPSWTKASLKLYHADCMDVMRQFPDGHFDLAVVDPPYGLDMASERPRKDGRFAHNKPRDWDKAIPTLEYFTELRRVSCEQIIWGGNYFPLPPHQCFVFWYKQNPVPNFSDGEYAWTSFKRPAKCFPFRYYGGLSGNTSAPEKIHISQKPIELYAWLLAEFAKPGQRILDTHLGSGSHAIAAHYAGMDFTGIELDADYFAAACERIERETAQGDMFTPLASESIFSQPSLI